MADDKIMQRIRKLLELAKSDNPNEAALAMERAQELMRKHGLDTEAVDLSQIKEAYVKSQFSVSRVKKYENVLVGAIASAFGCEVLWAASYSWKFGDNYAEWVFVGPADRLELATYTASVLMPQLKKARRGFAQKLSDRIWADEEFDPEWDKPVVRQIVKEKADAFALGWAWEIQKKVIKFALNDKEQELLHTYVERNSSGETNKSQDVQHDLGAMLAGREAAKDAHLHRPIGEDGEEQNLLGQTHQLEDQR